jgi:hypothetical protein
MLMLTWLLVTVALLAVFWGGSLVAQGYLYNLPADRLPLRAAGAALLVGTFLALWVWIDKRSPGKYDTFFEFSGERATDFNEFEAVRWQAVRDGNKIAFKKNERGEKVEITSKVTRGGGKEAKFIDKLTDKPFVLNPSTPQENAQLLTVAVVVKGEDGNPVRYTAQIKEDDRTGATYVGGTARFVEANGSRYVRGDQMGKLFIPSTGTVVVALLINLLHLVVWFAAFWLILRFSWGHALGFAVAFGLVTMLAVMPLLFKPNRTAPAPAPAETAALVRREMQTTAGGP